MRFDIFDHCGLDVDDVEKFRSMEKVRDKIKGIGKALSHVTRPRNERGNQLSNYGATDAIFEEAANGVFSWFILQYMRGYKPFVTIVLKVIKNQ